MIITRIKVDERNNDLTSIYYVEKQSDIELGEDREILYISNENTLKVKSELVLRYGLRVLDEYDDKFLNNIIHDNSLIKAKNKALRMLSLSLKTEKQIRDKLKDEYSPRVIEETIEKLKEYNLVDDRIYAKRYIKEKLSTRGKQRIISELYNKGISKRIIESSFDEDFKEDEVINAKNVALKKYSSLKNRETDPIKIKEKLYRFLLSRGYGYDVIKKIVDSVIEESEF